MASATTLTYQVYVAPIIAMAVKGHSGNPGSLARSLMKTPSPIRWRGRPSS
jgi:hypothetical protein